jgi:hypothetical protein
MGLSASGPIAGTPNSILLLSTYFFRLVFLFSYDSFDYSSYNLYYSSFQTKVD